MDQQEKVLFSKEETAKMLSVCSRTVWELAQKGDLQSVRVGRRLLFDKRDIVRFVDERKSQ